MNVLIVDGNNLCYRAAFGNYKSEHIGEFAIVRTYFKTLSNLIEKLNSELVICCWDGKKSKDRKRLIYPEYKQRNESDETSSLIAEETIRQMLLLRRHIIPHLPIVSISFKFWEADSAIASIVDLLREQSCIVFSSDKDFNQLLDFCDLWKPDLNLIYKREDFMRQYGFSPSRWPEFASLVGDPSDNICGIKGVGPVNAKRLVLSGKDCELWFTNAEDPIYSKLKGNYGTFCKYRAMIDLFKDPDYTSLKKSVKIKISKWTPTFKKEEIETFLFLNKATSMLRDFNETAFSFRSVFDGLQGKRIFN